MSTRSRPALLASSLVLLTSCTGWVPFLWADYGRGEGFTESQWLNTEANVGDLDQWSAGVGFAYGGFLPGLMEPRPAPIYLQPAAAVPMVPKDPDHPTNHSGELKAVGDWPWWTWLGIVPALGIIALIVWQIRRIIQGRANREPTE